MKYKLFSTPQIKELPKLFLNNLEAYNKIYCKFHATR